jgi:hypothetical protein
LRKRRDLPTGTATFLFTALALESGATTTARTWAEEALTIHRAPSTWCRFARAAAAEGAEDTATRILGAAETSREEIGIRWPYGVVDLNTVTLRDIRAGLGEASFAKAWDEGRNLSVDDVVVLAFRSVGAPADGPHQERTH